ncbi:MAG: hypothetical protein ACLUJR_08075 [Mediterraneibacter gnavus]
MGTRILFTGDSITDGNRYKEEKDRGDLNHQIGHSYAYVINAILGSKYPRKGFAVCESWNLRKPGDRSVRQNV